MSIAAPAVAPPGRRRAFLAWAQGLAFTAWAVSTLVFFAARGLPLGDALGLRLPAPGAALAWTAAFALLGVAHEAAARRFGLAPESRWQGPAGLLASRAATVAVLAPVAEELAFRGLLYYLLIGTPVGAMGAVVIPSLCFALLHLRARPAGMALVLADGLFFGLARHFTGSLLLAIALHMAGNAFAVRQRLRAPGARP